MSLQALREALADHGGTVADLLLAPDAPGAPAETPDGPAQRAARGPRTAARSDEYELLLEMIYEGSQLHYGAPRVLHCQDPDLALLIGDQLYALGLSRLAELGDLDAVAELADLISLLAQARSAGDASLAEAVWDASAAAIGWGGDPEHEAAKALARAGASQAPAALHAAARQKSSRAQ